MIFVTSDLHFNHENILKYETVSRPFENIHEMNETLIANWNEVVSPEDTVYVCGDFFMGAVEKIEPILTRLNGSIYVVAGNHDTPKRKEEYERLGCVVNDVMYKSYKGLYFIMSHFPPIAPEFTEMVRERGHGEVMCLYGHVHSGNRPIEGAYHVGVDTNDLKPVSLSRIANELRYN